MTVTIIGVLLTRDGLAQRPEVAEDGWTIRKRSWACAAVEMRQAQPPTIGLNLDHDHARTVGEIVALTKRRSGDCWAVAVAEADDLLDSERPCYLSAEASMYRDGSDVVVEAAALTHRPATICLPAVTVYPGRVDSPVARDGWHLDGFRREIAERAAETMRRRRQGDPILVHDDALPAVEERALASMHPAVMAQAMEDEFYARKELVKARLQYRPATILRVR